MYMYGHTCVDDAERVVHVDLLETVSVHVALQPEAVVLGVELTHLQSRARVGFVLTDVEQGA